MSPCSIAGSSHGRSVPSHDTTSSRCAGGEARGLTAAARPAWTPGVAIQTTHSDATTKAARPTDVARVRGGRPAAGCASTSSVISRAWRSTPPPRGRARLSASEQVARLLAVPPRDRRRPELTTIIGQRHSADARTPACAARYGHEEPGHLDEHEERRPRSRGRPSSSRRGGRGSALAGESETSGQSRSCRGASAAPAEGAGRQAVAKAPEVTHNGAGMIARRDLAVRVAARSDLSPTCFRLTLAPPEPFDAAPGQFGMLVVRRTGSTRCCGARSRSPGSSRRGDTRRSSC